MNKLTIVILIGVLSISSYGATTCGNAAWWTDIQSNLISKWNANDPLVKDFNSLRSAYNTLEATTVTSTHEVTKGHCKPYFTVDKDKSCCSSADHKRLINLAVRASIAAAIPEGKGDACQSLNHNFQKAVESCRSTLGGSASATAPNVTSSAGVIRSTSSATGTLPSGSAAGSGLPSGSGAGSGMPSGSGALAGSAGTSGVTVTISGSAGNLGSGLASALASMFGSLLGSGSGAIGASGSKTSVSAGSVLTSSVPSQSAASGSSQVPESVEKILDKADKLGKKAEANSRKALGDAAQVVAQQLRGTLCAICGDPDAKSSIFDPATSTWYANQAAMNDYIAQFAKALNETSSNGKDCLDFIQYNKKRFQSTIGTCAAAAKVIEDYKSKLTPCTTEAQCTKTVSTCFNPLSVGCVTSITADVTTSSSRRTRALGREQKRVLAPKYEATANGGAGLAADQSEDNALVIGGQNYENIQQQASTANTDFTATGGGSVDFDEALAAEMSNSTVFTIFGLFLIILISTF